MLRVTDEFRRSPCRPQTRLRGALTDALIERFND
jgi:hypothetical protein